MVSAAPATKLLGRQRERRVLGRVLEAAREGHGGSLAVYGEPGVGKTALLDAAVAAAAEFRVARATGVEGEIELAFAALQQLCSPSLELIERLPDPQRGALAVALGLENGKPASPFLVGLAVLNLLSEAPDERPLICVIDDAQWLDHASAQVFAFVARRLLAERIAMVFAAREPIPALDGIAELHVQPLGHRDARALLDSVLPARLDERVLERVVADTRGNPLALLELPRGLTPAEIAGGFGLPAALPLPGRIEQSFARRLALLPRDSRRLLLVAAADPTGDTALEWRAATLLGISESATDHSADFGGLIEFDAGVAFRHPLARSAVYRSAEPTERSAVHRALAEATDPVADPDRRAWHRAQAATRPDEDVAVELEGSAARAQARGGFSAAAAFLQRASLLSIDPARRSERAVAAAWAMQQAGALDDARSLLSQAEAGPLDDLQRAKVDVIRARIVFAAERGRDAPGLLLDAAKRVQLLNAAAASEIYLDALTAAIFAGRLSLDVDARQVASMALRTEAKPRDRATDLLLNGLATLICEGAAAGTPALRAALVAFGKDDIGTEEGLRWLWLAGRAAGYIWDYENWDALTRKQARLARESGALNVLPVTLSTRAGVELFAGNLEEAASLMAEGDAIIAATDGRSVTYAPVAVAAFRGREAEALALIRTSAEDFVARGEGMGLTLSQWARAFLNNGLGHYDAALAAAEQAAEDPHELWFSTWAMVELVEAAVRCDDRERAATALDVLREVTQASSTPWARGIDARARALLADGATAESLYQEAIRLLQPTRLHVDLARTHLLYGEWLRRERRRLDARSELRTAHEFFAGFGMEAFAERARVELQATGEHARKRTVDTLRELTPQEAQISRLVAKGQSNREIAAQLFISASTVEYHLRKVFRKLDVRTRTQLAGHVRT